MRVWFPLFFETVALAVVFVTALAARRESLRAIRGIEGVLTRVAKRRVLAGALVASFAFVLSASLSLLGRLPEPEVHDEFSYLLAADTFSHGRLANPTHPMWLHFETFQVIFQPTYASKYQPGQGLSLAIGQILTGYPIVGIWLTTAVACAAIFWMLLAWVPGWLALLGGIMTALHPGVLYWSQLYWGGQLGMTGGALLFGSFPRLSRNPTTGVSVLLGAGVALSALSRPYEGLLVAAPISIAIVFALTRGRLDRIKMLKRIFLPSALVVLLVALWMGFYDWRVTGNPLKLPYMVHEERYTVYPFFIWQQPRSVPTYHHKIFEDYHLVWERDWYEATKSPAGLINISLEKLKRPWILFQGLDYFRLVLTIPLLFLPWAVVSRRFRLVFAVVVVFLAGILLITWGGARISAPVTGGLILLYVYGLRRLRLFKSGGLPIGRVLLWAIVLVAIGTFGLEALRRIRDDAPRWYFERARIQHALEADGGRHLILVHYGSDHWSLQEWVYNGADIDGSKVVWAREMNPAADKELIDYFKDRKIWLLNVYDDYQDPTLTEYPLRQTWNSVK